MASGSGPTLGERSARAMKRDHAPAAGGRHCWVVDPPEATGKWPGVLIEWQKGLDGRWRGRTAYVVTASGRRVLIEDWVDAANLHEA
jgi:hypothetical protein